MAAVLPAYNELVNYIAQKIPQEILDFEASELAEARAEELLERNREGKLTSEERLELEQMADFDDLVALLKSAALKKLSQS